MMHVRFISDGCHLVNSLYMNQLGVNAVVNNADSQCKFYTDALGIWLEHKAVRKHTELYCRKCNRIKAPTHIHEMKLDLTGDVSLEQLTCRQCGANLNDDSVTLAAGALVVHCEYCGAQYQMEEAPKW